MIEKRAVVDMRRTGDHREAFGAWLRLKSAGSSLCLFAALYFGWVYIEPGLLTYFLTLFPIGIIVITAIARINDITVDMTSNAWTVRRNGLLITCVGAAMQALLPLVNGDWPTWRLVMILWGFALTWLTTPHQPPWPTYVWGTAHPYEHFDHPHRRKEDDFDVNP